MEPDPPAPKWRKSHAGAPSPGLALFLVSARLAHPGLEPLLAPFAPPLDFALSFRGHRYLFVRFIWISAQHTRRFA
jgi:hypothetical protein